MLFVFVFAIIYNYLNPRFPDYTRQSYQFIQESYRRPREFERYCKNMNATPEELRGKAQEIFDALPMLEKISMWEMLDQTIKGQLEKEMNDEEKESLKKHIEDVEKARRMQMMANAVSHVMHGPSHHHHPPGFGPHPW